MIGSQIPVTVQMTTLVTEIWGLDDHWGPVDNISDCEGNSVHMPMPDDSNFARDTEQILEGFPTTLSAGEEIEYFVWR